MAEHNSYKRNIPVEPSHKKGSLKHYFNSLFLGEDEKVKIELGNVRPLIEKSNFQLASPSLGILCIGGNSVLYPRLRSSPIVVGAHQLPRPYIMIAFHFVAHRPQYLGHDTMVSESLLIGCFPRLLIEEFQDERHDRG